MHTARLAIRPTILIVWCGLSIFLVASAAAADGPDFAREVRPLLSNRCFKCHGPDEGNRQAGLRLDLRDEAIRELDSGSRALVPGHPDDSELIARITSTDPDLVMPPPHTKVSLGDEEKRILRDWVAAGGDYRPHWAFVKPERPNLPEPRQDAWPRNEIDRFVLARLESEGLTPGDEADRATLCRRVHLDLVGLPPSPAEVDAFVADPATDAYEQLVDRLLASPRYGERWARRWLDLARYADTNGYEKDRPRQIWPYRDWVIRALNDDMPFDQFTIRQIAGDLLPAATTDDIIATGFHRNTMVNEEGGTDPLEFRYLAMVDRVATTGATWLGLTTGCAQCHTHKFDPITHTDYFSLMALMNNADELSWVIPDGRLERERSMIRSQIEAQTAALASHWPAPGLPSSDKATVGPEASPNSPAAEARREMALAARFDAWNREETQRAVDWTIVRPTAMTSSMPRLSVRDDGAILAAGDITKSDVFQLTLPTVGTPIAAIRLEALPDASLPRGGPGMTHYEGPEGDFLLSEIEVEVGGRPRRIATASHSYASGKNTADRAIDGEMTSGWSIDGGQGRPHAAVFVLESPALPGEPVEITLRCERHFACAIGCFRISVAANAAAGARGRSAEVEAALAVPPETRSLTDRERIFRSFLLTSKELEKPVARIRELERRLFEGQRTLVLRERPAAHPRPTFLHHRGEYTQPKAEVPPAVPAFLPQLPEGAPANRLALARWLVSADNPLTARVQVNRHWQAFFGRGIVPTLEDFGYQSEPPSNPELLDWLAVTFARNLGWSTKRLHRLVVTSATYRQASEATPAILERDPANILLARGPRVRLEAEVIRDTVLEAASLLSDKMYGPGVRPPQPEGVTEVAYGDKTWQVSAGEDRHRRSIYTFQKRTAPFAMVTTFDGPTGEACLARREVSNSALQALTLLNDPMFVEAAQTLGRRAIAAGNEDSARLRELSRRLLSRELDPEETRTLIDYLNAQRTRLAAGELDAAKLAGGETTDALERAAWMLVARALMNLDEAIVKR